MRIRRSLDSIEELHVAYIVEVDLVFEYDY